MNEEYRTYSEKWLLLTKDCDVNTKWRASSLLEAMQTTAGNQCELLGAGKDEMDAMGVTWVLARSEIEINRWPGYGEEITVLTVPLANRHFMFPRYFSFTDADGKLIGQAHTAWSLFDISKRSIVTKVDDIARLLPDNSDLGVPTVIPQQIRNIEGEETLTSYRPLYTDLDFNGHVNNTKYVDFLCNTLGLETMKKCEFSRLAFNYKIEVTPETDLTLRLIRNDRQFVLIGEDGASEAFRIGGEMRERK